MQFDDKQVEAGEGSETAVKEGRPKRLRTPSPRNVARESSSRYASRDERRALNESPSQFRSSRDERLSVNESTNRFHSFREVSPSPQVRLLPIQPPPSHSASPQDRHPLIQPPPSRLDTKGSPPPPPYHQYIPAPIHQTPPRYPSPHDRLHPIQPNRTHSPSPHDSNLDTEIVDSPDVSSSSGARVPGGARDACWGCAHVIFASGREHTIRQLREMQKKD
mmetsp:Transcript_13922/g.23229  ORF Transcript_13922/g.23229 Transcript_13922/m.23229 type:complete len:220 (+) Transcript_13922:352-1011(+)